VNTQDSEQEIERRTDEEMTIQEQLLQQRKHLIDDDENGMSMPTMPRKTETRATKSQSTKRM